MKQLLLTLFLFIFYPAIVSANYACDGDVTYLGVSANGILSVNIGYGVWNMCSLSYDDQNSAADKTICKVWYSQALAAKLNSSKIRIYLSDSSGKDQSACTSVGTWVSPADKIYHIETE